MAGAIAALYLQSSGYRFMPNPVIKKNASALKYCFTGSYSELAGPYNGDITTNYGE